MRIALVATRNISKSEELTYDYVPTYDGARKAKRNSEGVKCLCGAGADACRKFIWPAAK